MKRPTEAEKAIQRKIDELDKQITLLQSMRGNLSLLLTELKEQREDRARDSKQVMKEFGK